MEPSTRRPKPNWPRHKKSMARWACHFIKPINKEHSMIMNQTSNESNEQPLAPLMAELHQRATEQGIPFHASVFDQSGQAVIQTVWHFPEQAALGAQRCLPPLDMAEVIAQEHVKRALEVAASGGHNVLLIGAPGAGKRFLARMLPSLLTNQDGVPLPLRTPHHTIEYADFVGQPAHPGEMCFAHGGVLFLRHLPAFAPEILAALTQAVEERSVTMGRETEMTRFPARFVLVASMEPCPCGFYGDPIRECECTAEAIIAYQLRIKGAVGACFDLYVEVPCLRLDQYEHSRRTRESSTAIRARVAVARAIQERRFAGLPIACNVEMRGTEIAQFCEMDSSAQRLWKAAMQ